MTSPLTTLLAALPVGPIQDISAVEKLLIQEWGSFTGSKEGGMEPYKLSGRTEDMVWEPPSLKFTIERHGGTVLGSTRAELQYWEINTETRSAKIAKSGRRQLEPADKRLNVRPLVESVANAIINGLESPSLKRFPDGRVKVQIGAVVPETFKQTTTARRKRFRKALEPMLLDAGWVPAGVNTYQRKDASL